MSRRDARFFSGLLEERGTTSQVAALDISKKAMTSAERNVLSAFELAQKIVQTKDTQELVRMQTEFLQSQMQALGEQVKDLGETISKAAMDTVKIPTKGGLIVLNCCRQARRRCNEVDCYPARRSRAPRQVGPADSHDHIEVVPALEWRGDLRHAARGAHSVRIGPTTASNLCYPVASQTAHRTRLRSRSPLRGYVPMLSTPSRSKCRAIVQRTQQLRGAAKHAQLRCNDVF